MPYVDDGEKKLEDGGVHGLRAGLALADLLLLAVRAVLAPDLVRVRLHFVVDGAADGGFLDVEPSSLGEGRRVQIAARPAPQGFVGRARDRRAAAVRQTPERADDEEGDLASELVPLRHAAEAPPAAGPRPPLTLATAAPGQERRVGLVGHGLRPRHGRRATRRTRGPKDRPVRGPRRQRPVRYATPPGGTRAADRAALDR